VRFTDIPPIIEHTLTQIDSVEPRSINVVQEADSLAREVALKFIAEALAA
jgi:1-deoxy-D-xylulose 5-phosphate reductoisomerase